MKKPKIVILRGKPTSGKSTAWHNLKKRKEMGDWLFVDHGTLKKNLGKELGKKSLFAVLKTVMPTKKNIIIEESSEKTLKKYISRQIKKYNYEIITFQFEVSLKTAYKRNIQRAKDKWHPLLTKKWIKHTHKIHEERFDKNAYLVDCNKLGKRQVINFILKKLELR
jgi:predicted kinase